jgi:gamma-glutamyltranspeptidase / glutathione hydrolase
VKFRSLQPPSRFARETREATSPTRGEVTNGVALHFISALTCGTIFLILASFALLPVARGETPLAPAQAVIARHAMVVSQEKRATHIGLEVLHKDGNAVDAAVAVGFALAVTHPQAGNLGGGGFMLIRRADGSASVIDYRETAPRAATRDMFLDERGEYDPKKSRDSGLAVGVPGTVAGLALALEKYGSGKFTLADLIAPAIALARDGIAVEDELADSLPRAAPRLARFPASAKIFLQSNGAALAPGEKLMQTDLARALETIARDGSRGFYEGPIAQKIVDSVREAGGILSRDDLSDYQALERAPVRGSYRGHEIVSVPPPSSGGVHLIEMLNILETYPLASLGARSPAALHLMIEAMKRAYADRAKFLGDSDQVSVPVERLISKSHAASLRQTIDPEHATPALALRPEASGAHEGDHTTHFSVIDRFGNAVSNTYTLNFNYGLGLVAEGTGILLNNELDDFAAKPGAPNAFGLVGGEANAPSPGKRPLSSMTPTIVIEDGKPRLITGSPGGSRIITIVLQVILGVLDFHQDIAQAVSAPRVHDQWLPDVVAAESGFAEDTLRQLEARGHRLRVGGTWGAANSILIAPDAIEGAADPRTRGAAAEGE